MYEVEDGVPLPPPLAPKTKYGFGRLGVGQSIFFPEENSGAAIRSAASDFAMRHGVRLAVRRVEGGHRVWRVE